MVYTPTKNPVLAELEASLERISGVSIIESSQVAGSCLLRVSFEAGKRYRDVAKFAHRIAQLYRIETGVDIEPETYWVDVSLKWDGDKRLPYVVIELPPEGVKIAASVLARVGSELAHDS